MHILHETPIGYALFKVAPLQMDGICPYKSTKEAVDAVERAANGEVSMDVLKLISKKKVAALGVSNTKVAERIKEQIKENGGASIRVETGEEIDAVAREIHERMAELLNINSVELNRACLLLAHALSRKKLEMVPQKMDHVLVQSIKMLEKLDKDINNKCMRVREWYGMHFPELDKIFEDNKVYLENVQRQLQGEEVDEEVKEAMEKTIGGDLNSEDKSLLLQNVSLVLQMYTTRATLQEHLRKRMHQIAPNILELLGEYTGAKMIAHAGSLSELAMKSASTIQVMGAEKALFKALKEKGSTPKHGHLFGSPQVGQAPLEMKGQIARALAAKTALAARCDAASESPDGSFGRISREKIDKRLTDLQARKRVVRKQEGSKRTEKFSYKRPAPNNGAAQKRNKVRK